MSLEGPVLGIDTSGYTCSVALVCSGQTIALRDEFQERGQAERLFPMLFEIIAEANQDWSSLQAVAVVTGPGNHTGIRLAVSAARGLSLSLRIPTVGVSAFEAAAHGADLPCHVIIEAPHGRAHAQTVPGGSG